MRRSLLSVPISLYVQGYLLTTCCANNAAKNADHILKDFIVRKDETCNPALIVSFKCSSYIHSSQDDKQYLAALRRVGFYYNKTGANS